MFALADFLIYCFVCAYTPGANNILSMTYASKLGFRRSFRFNLGITAGFLVVMSVCVIFSSTLYTLLPKVKILLQIITTKVSAGVSTHIGDLKIFLCLIIFYNPYRRRWQFR